MSNNIQKAAEYVEKRLFISEKAIFGIFEYLSKNATDESISVMLKNYGDSILKLQDEFKLEIDKMNKETDKALAAANEMLDSLTNREVNEDVEKKKKSSGAYNWFWG